MINPTLIFIIGGALAFILLLVGIVVSLTSERTLANERIDQIVASGRPLPDKKKNQHPSPLTDFLNSRVEKSDWASGISKELARADLKMKPGEYIAVVIIAILGLGMIAWLLGGQQILSFIIGGIIGFFIPRFYLNSQKSKRLRKFNNQLPDMLSLMVNGLRAGYSTMQSMESVSRELPSPINDEFRRVVQEMQLGVPMERALDNLLRRIPSEDLDLCITAINVQREVGGNLAEILDTISFTIRERIRIKGEIRVLTTQTSYSGKMLSLMPVAVIVALYFLNRQYMLEFFNKESRPCNFIALGAATLMIIIGYFVMQKLADIEV